MSQDKLQILSRLPTETQALFDAEVLAAYNRGKADHIRKEGRNFNIVWGVAFILVVILGLMTLPQIVRNKFPRMVVPDVEPAEQWQPIRKTADGTTIWRFHPVDGVTCYRSDHHDSQMWSGCVNNKEK